MENRAESPWSRSGALLKQTDGTLWGELNLAHYFVRAMEGVTFNNPDRVTMYALRQTSIVRQLLANVRSVAALHDTSVVMIEKNYSAFIADHADELMRATWPTPPEVVPLGGPRAHSMGSRAISNSKGAPAVAAAEIIRKQAAEIARLQDAKPRALAIADDQSKENAARIRACGR